LVKKVKGLYRDNDPEIRKCLLKGNRKWAKQD
jgi:hypothetical protein